MDIIIITIIILFTIISILLIIFILIVSILFIIRIILIIRSSIRAFEIQSAHLMIQWDEQMSDVAKPDVQNASTQRNFEINEHWNQ